MIAHILLLPHPEHRERLLAPGAPVAIEDFDEADERGHSESAGWSFGWSVGMAREGDDPGRFWWCVDHIHHGAALLRESRAAGHLVLARDGAVVDEGSDRLSRVARLDRHTVDIVIGARLRGRRNDGEGEITRFGTLVLIGVDGREVAS